MSTTKPTIAWHASKLPSVNFTNLTYFCCFLVMKHPFKNNMTHQFKIACLKIMNTLFKKHLCLCIVSLNNLHTSIHVLYNIFIDDMNQLILSTYFQIILFSCYHGYQVKIVTPKYLFLIRLVGHLLSQ